MKHTLIKMNLVKLGKNKTTTTKSKPSKNKTKQKQTIKYSGKEGILKILSFFV